MFGERVGAALVACVAGMTERPRFLLSKGGITSSDVATQGLGMTRAEVSTAKGAAAAIKNIYVGCCEGSAVFCGCGLFRTVYRRARFTRPSLERLGGRTSEYIFSPFRCCCLLRSVPDSRGEFRSDVFVIAYRSDSFQPIRKLDLSPRPGIVGVRGSMVIRLRPCMISSTLPHPPSSSNHARALVNRLWGRFSRGYQCGRWRATVAGPGCLLLSFPATLEGKRLWWRP